MEIKKLKERLKIIDKNLENINQKKNGMKNREMLFNRYKRVNTLNHYIVDNFIDRIVIGKYNTQTNSRDIQIIWNFI